MGELQAPLSAPQHLQLHRSARPVCPADGAPERREGGGDRHPARLSRAPRDRVAGGLFRQYPGAAHSTQRQAQLCRLSAAVPGGGSGGLRSPALPLRGAGRGHRRRSHHRHQPHLPDHAGLSGQGGLQRSHPRLPAGGGDLACAAGQDRHLGQGDRADGFGQGGLAVCHRPVRARDHPGLCRSPAAPDARRGGGPRDRHLATAAGGGHRPGSAGRTACRLAAGLPEPRHPALSYRAARYSVAGRAGGQRRRAIVDLWRAGGACQPAGSLAAGSGRHPGRRHRHPGQARCRLRHRPARLLEGGGGLCAPRPCLSRRAAGPYPH